MITELYCRNCDRHTRHTFTGNFKDGIRLLGRYVCKDCGTEQEDEPQRVSGIKPLEEMRRLAQDVKQQQDRLVEAVWRAIVGNDTPKKEDGELIIQSQYGIATAYHFVYKGEEAAALTIKEYLPGRFSYAIDPGKIDVQEIMEKIKEMAAEEDGKEKIWLPAMRETGVSKQE